MSDKSKTKKNQNKNEKNPKYKPKPFKEQAKEARIPQSKPKIEKTLPPAPKNIKPEFDSDDPDGKKVQVDVNHPFPDLKRETDDILKISEKPNSKYAKREIKSNWPEFEMPSQDDNDDEEVSQGADFEALLQMPMSVGGHFQFKHEKTWTQRKNSTGYTDLFGLDAVMISDAISCIPFYERNSLDPSLFSEEQVSRMINTAKKNKANFDKKLPIVSDRKEISNNSVKKARTTSEIEKNKKSDSTPSEYPDQLLLKDMSNVTSKDAISKKLEKVVINDDDELDMLLETVLQPVNNIKCAGPRPSMSSGSETIAIPNVPSDIKTTPQSPKVNTPPDVDLDKWLDDYLES